MLKRYRVADRQSLGIVHADVPEDAQGGVVLDPFRNRRQTQSPAAPIAAKSRAK